MRKILIAILSLISIELLAQQTVTHHEIENDVKPSGKLELYYANTGFPINDFFVGKHYTFLFSRYTQAFFLLENQTGLIADQLFMKDIAGLKSGKMTYSSPRVRRKHKAHYDLYLMGYQRVTAKTITRLNDTLFDCGVVRIKNNHYVHFYVSWSESGKLRYQMVDNIPDEPDFEKPEMKDITFNSHYAGITIMGHYYFPESRFLLLSKSPWEKDKRSSQCSRYGAIMYAKNSEGKYSEAFGVEGRPIRLLFDNEKVFLYSHIQKDIVILSGDSILVQIPVSGINYRNWLVKDEATQKIYLFADVAYKRENNLSNQTSEFFREGKYNKHEKLYDIYELDADTYQFKSRYHIKITGQIAQYINEKTNIFVNDANFRIFNQQVYLNIPVYSPDEQLGIFKLDLDWEKDTTTIHTYQKEEFSFMQKNEGSFQEIEQSIFLAKEDNFQPMPGKYAKIVSGKRFHKNDAKSIDELLAAIENAIENAPEELPVTFVAYDNQAIGAMGAHHANNYLYDAIKNMVHQWKDPLNDMLTAISVAGNAVVVEQKGELRYYTTPDGWHCSFVKIKNEWYLYYQFHKFDQLHLLHDEEDDMNLPTIEYGKLR
ncbi:MAG: hypothetical protein R6U85_02455 [Salinivirgaceae bacterium]